MAEREIFFTVDGSINWEGEDYEVRDRIMEAIRKALGGGVEVDISITDEE